MQKNQKHIPLVRAAYKQPFVQAMLKNGVDPETYFERVGLPANQNESPESLLPEKPFWKLINLVAVQENIPDFGIQVAQTTPWHRIASLIPLIQSSQSLEQLLVTFCEISLSQSNTSRFSLEREPSQAYFCSDTKTLFRSDRQMELYRVTSMIQLVQLAAGSGWRPNQVDFQMQPFKSFPGHTFYDNSRLCFAQPNSRVHIPDILLKMPVHLDIPATTGTTQQYDIDQDFGSTVLQLMNIYAASGNCKIEFIAEVTGLSVRSLQRKLAKRGMRFKQLLNEARFELARSMLQSSTLNMTEIAVSLGYTDPAHFTRAFRNWSGVSPSEYRKLSNL